MLEFDFTTFFPVAKLDTLTEFDFGCTCAHLSLS